MTTVTTKTYATRDSATALLKKMGVDKANYNLFISKTDGDKFVVNVSAAEAWLNPAAEETTVEAPAAEETVTEKPAKKAKGDRDNSKFQGGFRKPTYICGCCGKRTRETGAGESSCDLCAFCYHEAGLENSLSDGNITQEEFDLEHAALVAKYKGGPKVKRPTVAGVARELILAGLSNHEVFVKLQEQFGIGDEKKHYPSWYRCDLKRKGLLEGVVAAKEESGEEF